MERWSYKPEVEGLNPSLGTNLSGRDSSRQNVDCQRAWSSQRRVGLTPRPMLAARVPGIGLLNRTSEELGGKARGSTPPRASNFGCVAQTAEQASHKRQVGGSTPPAATKFGLVM